MNMRRVDSRLEVGRCHHLLPSEHLQDSRDDLERRTVVVVVQILVLLLDLAATSQRPALP